MNNKRSIHLVAGAFLALTLAACSTSSNAGTTPSVAVDSTLVGYGCADYLQQIPSTGAGSLDDMAQEPVTSAIANSPMLTTLNSAITGQLNPEVNMVDTLNDNEFTVFAAVDEAYSAIVPEMMEGFSNSVRVVTIFTSYQVVTGRLAPGDVVGTHPTLEGHDLPVTGSGDDLTVHGLKFVTDGKANVNEAKVICGGIQTQNGTLYLVDALLTPPV